MNLLVRNVDVVAVKKIDKLAKEQNMSRQELLKSLIEKFSMFDVFKEEQNRFDYTMQMITDVLNQTMKMMQSQQEEILKMKAMFMLVMDIDEKEINEFIEDFLKRG